MNAKETYEMTRRFGILTQYEDAQKDIQQAREWNHLECHATHNPLFFEVALKLAEEGFEVKTVLRNELYSSYTSISWMNGWKEDNVGTLQVINEAKGDYEKIANGLGYGILVPGVTYVINSEGEPVPKGCTIQQNPFEEKSDEADKTEMPEEAEDEMDDPTWEVPELHEEDMWWYQTPKPPKKSFWEKILEFIRD